jgi:hypothetical protein
MALLIEIQVRIIGKTLYALKSCLYQTSGWKLPGLDTVAGDE